MLGKSGITGIDGATGADDLALGGASRSSGGQRLLDEHDEKGGTTVPFPDAH